MKVSYTIEGDKTEDEIEEKEVRGLITALWVFHVKFEDTTGFDKVQWDSIVAELEVTEKEYWENFRKGPGLT